MEKSIKVSCPNCGSAIDVDEILNKQAEEKYRKEFENQKAILEVQQQKFEEDKKRARDEYAQKLDAERQKIKSEESQLARQKILEEFKLQMQVQQEELENRKKENAELKRKEVEFLRKEELLKEKEQEIDLQIQRKLKEERENLEEKIKKQEYEKNQIKENDYQLKIREYEYQLDTQKKLVEEMKRKAEQGSMQLQGEVQELALEEILRTSFPFDVISEVGKGVRGADAIQLVHNKFGQNCGKIIYESKRTKSFSNDWIEKLKADMRLQQADVAVLVTETFPKDLERFGEKDGIWICHFSEVIPVAYLLRDSIIKISAATQSQENKGEKMAMLYTYLTSNEFTEQWNAIREGFLQMKLSIQTERVAMEKLWKSREKQLEKVLLNAAHIHGSIEGIAGNSLSGFKEINSIENALDVE